MIVAADHPARGALAVGSNPTAMADRYVAAGASLVLVGADVSLLARSSEALADRYLGAHGGDRASY